MTHFPVSRPPAKSAPRRTKEKPPKGCGYAFEADESIPVDFFGLQTCVHCHAVGKPGDARHPFGSPAAPPKWPPVPEADVSDRIIGESGDAA